MLSSLTRISAVNLEAIENGNFSALPVPIYTRNFIKIYTRALKMDGQPILDSYEAYLQSLKTMPEQIPEKAKPQETEKENNEEKVFFCTAALQRLYHCGYCNHCCHYGYCSAAANDYAGHNSPQTRNR